MKKTSFNLNSIIAVLITVLFISFSGTASAADGKGNIPVKIEYLGSADESPVFQVTFSNETEEEYVIVIRDNSNNVLYSEKVKGKNVNRKFQLVNEGLADDEIHFEITNRKANTSVSYKTTSSTEVVKDINVVEVK